MKNRKRLSIKSLPYYEQRRIDMAGTKKKRDKKKDSAIVRRLNKNESGLDLFNNGLGLMIIEIDGVKLNGLTCNGTEVK